MCCAGQSGMLLPPSLRGGEGRVGGLFPVDQQAL